MEEETGGASSDSKTERPPGLRTKYTLHPSMKGGPATKMLPVCLRALLSLWGAAGVFLLLQAMLRLHLIPRFPHPTPRCQGWWQTPLPTDLFPRGWVHM